MEPVKSNGSHLVSSHIDRNSYIKKTKKQHGAWIEPAFSTGYGDIQSAIQRKRHRCRTKKIEDDRWNKRRMSGFMFITQITFAQLPKENT